MRKVKKKRLLKRIGKIILVISIIGLCYVGLDKYFARIDAVAKEIQEKSEIAFITKDNPMNEEGLYVANLDEDLIDFVEEKKVGSVTYEFDGEQFYLELAIRKDDKGEISFEITKIVNEEFGIKAMMNFEDVKSVEYRSDERSKSSVLKINALYNTSYFAMTNGTYYFLGQDVESISYRDGHFYYLTYNPDYRTLKTATSCSKTVKNSIDGFNMNDYYYKYGKINFLTDYYQKLSSKTYKVKDRCGEFEKKE